MPRHPWWWNGALLCLAVAMGIYLLAPTEADPDLWGHVRFGLDLLNAGDVIFVDGYSYMSGGQPWVNHEWASEALMALAFRRRAVPGLVELKVAIGLALAGLLVWHLYRVQGTAANRFVSRDGKESSLIHTGLCHHDLRNRNAEPAPLPCDAGSGAGSGSGSDAAAGAGAGGTRLLAALLMAVYGLAVMLPGVRSLRPQAFTYLAFLGVLLLLYRAERDGQRPLWWTVPLLTVWANLHGGFVAGLGVMIVWLVTRLVTAPKRDWLAVVPVATACAATLINPYGIGLWRFLWHTLGPRPDIAEWQAVPLASAEGVAYLAVLVFGIIGIAGISRQLRDRGRSSERGRGSERRWTVVVLFACGAVLPFIARRHLPLFVMITLVFCAEHTATAIATFVRQRWPRADAGGGDAAGNGATDRFRPLVAGILVFVAMLLLAIAWPNVSRIRVNAAAFPITPTMVLARSGVAANLAVDFDWGEYVIWQVGPRVKVSVDGRRETVYSDAAYDENVQFTNGAGEWDRLLTRHPTDLALVSTRTPVFALLSQRPDWELLLQDESSASALFGRRGGAATERVRATPVPVIDPRLASEFP
jgi:hypothetical protein